MQQLASISKFAKIGQKKPNVPVTFDLIIIR